MSEVRSQVIQSVAGDKEGSSGIIEEKEDSAIRKIVLTEEQMQVVRQSCSPVQVCDSQGIVLGTVDPELSPEFIAVMKRRAAAPGPRYTGEQVQRHMQGLQEAWDREGPFDEKRTREILKELRAADQT